MTVKIGVKGLVNREYDIGRRVSRDLTDHPKLAPEGMLLVYEALDSNHGPSYFYIA